MIAGVMAAATVFTAHGVSAQAAQTKAKDNGIKVIQASYKTTNVTSKDIDVTGDGIADVVKIKMGKKADSDMYRGYTITINGKKAFTTKQESFAVDVSVATLSNKSVYVHIRDYIEDDDYNICAFYKYDNATMKLTKVLSADPLAAWGTHTDSMPYFVSGKKIYALGGGMLNSTGSTSCDIVYVEKKGRLTLKGFKFRGFQTIQSVKKNKLTKSLVIRRDLTAFRHDTCKGDSVQILKDRKVTFTSMKIKKGNLVFGITFKGKKWYYKASKRYNQNWQFRNLFFAG